ncbi:MAG: DUF3182 family protein [Pusillimonas sp.]
MNRKPGSGFHRPQNPGIVLLYPARRHEPEHERAVYLKLGERIAQVLDRRWGGLYDAGIRHELPLYLIPTCTLIGADIARQLGIRSENALYGGVAPAAFVPTKSITHPLASPDAFAPEGWSHEFGLRIEDCVLNGITAFTIEDAIKAGERLLTHGAIRIKPVLATAGRGQEVVSCKAGLAQVVERQDREQLAQYGLVLEENLDEVNTFSVGQLRIGNIVASYVGTQCLTADNQGHTVYGGSDLIVVRGGFEQLLRLKLSPEYQVAIARAKIYDQAAMACFPGLIASRRNYDIASGTSTAGEPRCGVLEQSWRIGGASAAEIAAVQAFHADDTLQVVQATTVELFGVDAQAPDGAETLFSGNDPELGPISKYVKVQSYGN